MNNFHTVWFLAKRFLFRREGWFQFNRISQISIVGVAIGVASLSVALAISSGFQKAFRDSIFGLSSHAFYVSRHGNFKIKDEIQTFSTDADFARAMPVLYQEGMVAFEGRVAGVVMKSVPWEEARSQGFFKRLKILDESESNSNQGKGLILGKTLAERLQVKGGQEVQVIFSTQNGAYVVKPQTVIGIFHSGMYEFDERFALTDLQHLQALVRKPDEVSGVEVWIHSPDDIDVWIERNRENISAPFQMISWREFYANLFAALKLERVVFFLVILPIVVVGSLTVVAGLLMFIQEKKKSIVVLKIIGLSKKAIQVVFLIQGLVVGTLGIGLGLALGLCINLFLHYFPIVPVAAEVYLIDRLPILISFTDLALIAVVTLAICLLSSWFPSAKAAGLQPVEVLHGRK